MNDKLTWSDHVVKVSQRIFIGLRSLWPLSKSTPLRTRFILAKALLLPHIDYCSPVFYYGLDAESMSVLVRSVKSIVRYVYGLKRYGSTEGYIERFLGSSLDTFLRVKSMTFLYKIDRSRQPCYLSELLLRGQSARSMQLVVRRCNLELGKKSLFVRGFCDWNLIPVRIRTVNSVNLFKLRCTELFNNRNYPTIYV